MPDTRIFILFVSLTLLYGCYERDRLPNPPEKISPAFTPYFGIFRPGSKWVYDISGSTDSLVEEVIQYSPGNTVISSSMAPYEYRFSIENNVFSVRYKDQWNSGGHAMTEKHDSISAIRESEVDPVWENYTSRIDSMYIGACLYRNVLHSVESADNYYQEYYFAPETGVIKKLEKYRQTLPKIYTLRRYTIIR